MRSFFDAMEPWRQPEGSLHLYVLPDDDTLDRLEPVREALAGVENLPLMPRAYLHLTVQRLAQFDDLSAAEFTALAHHLTEVFDDLPAFALRFGSPSLYETAAGLTADPSPEWDALVAGTRRVLASAFPDDDLPAPPHAPHLSLAYATGPAPDQVARERLTGHPALGEVRVASVRLVSVTVRPEVGVFDFTELAGWRLGPRA